MSNAWYFDTGNEQVGPLSIQELTATLATYPDPRGMFVWRAGFEDWKRACEVWDLANLLPPTSQRPLPPVSTTVKADPQSRNAGVSHVGELHNEPPEAPHTRQYNNFIA